MNHLCKQCGSEMEYGGTYREGSVCMAIVDLVVCPDCKLEHQVMWIGPREKIVYPSTSQLWIWDAGEGPGIEQ